MIKTGASQGIKYKSSKLLLLTLNHCYQSSLPQSCPQTFQFKAVLSNQLKIKVRFILSTVT